VLITGAAGNLGGLLARRLAAAECALRLMVHRTPLPPELQAAANVTPVRADLSQPASLPPAVEGADVVVHFAGVLFAPRPEKFLPETNTRWLANLLTVSLEAGVRRFILISFAHVEGPTSAEEPATGCLDGIPTSVHARTRLEEERLLIGRTRSTVTTPVILRLGMVYGRGILMIEAARWLARRRLLAGWPEPTWIHLLSKPDYLSATERAVLLPGVQGIYHLGDDQPVTLQHFLDTICRAWGLPRPHRAPGWLIAATAGLCEVWAMISRRLAPLTRDFIRIGRASYFGDTRRARQALLPTLQYPTLESGLGLL
jgi:nucleoside-diphosphate-sugar epimerase